MSASSTSGVTRLYRVCDPHEPLNPDDKRYVNCDDVRGENVVEEYELRLRLAEPDSSEIKLFAGHRGIGKTSELFRLQRNLQRTTASSPAFVVLYFDVEDVLDVNDLDFPDLLVAIASEVQKQLQAAKIPDFSPITTYFKRLWEDLKGALGAEVNVKETEIEMPFGSLTLELRNRPNSRARMRAAIESHSTSFLAALNDLLLTARAAIRKQGKAGLVLLIDGLDKIPPRTLSDGVTHTHDRLFFDRAEQLAALEAHVIYTVPISLIYSPRCTHLEHACGSHTVPVTMIRIRGDHRSEPTPDTLGMRKLTEILRARCARAELTFEEAFEEAAAIYLCRMSGGHPRHLMMFVRSAIAHLDHLPITLSAAERAVRNYANSLLREVSDEAWTELPRFNQPQLRMPKDKLHQDMLYFLWVFEYMNGTPWYEVNPVLRTTHRFEHGGRS